MRIYVVLRYAALALLINAVFLIVASIISLFNHETSFMPLLYTAIITILFGLFPLIFTPAVQNITNKEGLSIVVSSWLISCLLGAIPYILWGGHFDFTNAWFESVSGFTTTGSTILSDIEGLPKGLLFWRASTHWIGGIGIVIFALSVLPYLGISETVLFRTEFSPVARENFRHRARTAIKILAGIYVVLTILETTALAIAGMNLFDAITHSFATIATGGFSTKNLSIAYYNNPTIEIIILVFMIFSGMNFALLFALFTGSLKKFWNSTVLQYYILSMAAGILVTAFLVQGHYNNDFWEALRFSAFNIASLGTSTGFATTDTSIWPHSTFIIIIFFSLQCASAGSTSGGIKTDRVVIFFKALLVEFQKLKHPKAVFSIKIGGSAIKESLVQSSMVYIILYLVMVVIASVLITFTGVDVLSAFTGVVAAAGNVGPGLGTVGSLENYNHLPILSKYILSVVMLLGRLEIYALIIFFSKSQWSSKITY